MEEIRTSYVSLFFAYMNNCNSGKSDANEIAKRLELINKEVMPYYLMIDNEQTFRRSVNSFVTLWEEWIHRNGNSNYFFDSHLLNIKKDENGKYNFQTPEIDIQCDKWFLAISTNQCFSIPISVLKKSIVIMERLLICSSQKGVPLFLTDLNNNRIILICIILALKSDSEFVPSFSLWVKLINDLYTEEDLLSLEKDTLELLEMDTVVTDNDLYEFCSTLQSQIRENN